MKDIDLSRKHFHVDGAGVVQIGNSASCRCGQSVGVSIGVSWGTHGYAGGVMDRKEVRKMISHLQRLLGEAEMPSDNILDAIDSSRWAAVTPELMEKIIMKHMAATDEPIVVEASAPTQVDLSPRELRMTDDDLRRAVVDHDDE